MCTTFGSNNEMGISAGAFGGYYAEKYSNVNLSLWTICVQGNFHFMPLEKLDFYTGLYAGYSYAGSNKSTASSSDVGGQIGARYFFSDAVGGFLQIGGFSTISIGFSFKL